MPPECPDGTQGPRASPTPGLSRGSNCESAQVHWMPGTSPGMTARGKFNGELGYLGL
jgi:hypothetical protein